MNIIQKINVCALLSLSVLSAKAQTTYMEMEQLTVNDQVTTVITASEPIRFVDISTDKVVGDQPINNIIRLKPKDNVYADGEVLAIVTIVTERYRTQYALLYTTRMQEAVTDKEIECSERNAYNNPAVSLSRHDQVCASDMVIGCQVSQCGDEDAPHGDASEQYLQRGRIFLHRLLRGEQDQHPLRH